MPPTVEGLEPDQPGALFRAMLDVLHTVHYDRETGWNRPLKKSDEGVWGSNNLSMIRI